jgi:hypothetical protein
MRGSAERPLADARCLLAHVNTTVTPNQFRRIALSLPDAVEGAHMGHADFRVGGKIFATLGRPDSAWGVALLEPDQQALLIETAPKVFFPVPGDWGRKGGTRVNLAAVDRATLKHVLGLAWKKRAPKALLARFNNGRTVKRAAPPSPDRAFARARKAAKATKLPGIEEATSYGTPSLTVRGKLLLRLKDADTLVLRCALEDKAMLIEAAPEIYFETDHYVGWPAVLARLPAIGDAELAHRLEQAWHLQAPKKLKAEYANAHPAPIKSAQTKTKIAKKNKKKQ